MNHVENRIHSFVLLNKRKYIMSNSLIATLSALAALSMLAVGCTSETAEGDRPEITVSEATVNPKAGCNAGSVGTVSYFGTCTSGSGSCFGVKSNGTTCSGADFSCTQSNTAPGGYRWVQSGPTISVFMPDNSDQVCVGD